MIKLRVFASVALIFWVVSFASLILLPTFSTAIDGMNKALLEASILTALATPAVFFTVLRPRMNARKNTELEFARLNRELEAEIVAHREVEEALRAREEELRRHADEIEYNQSFIETHAAEMVALAEQISAQKNDVEESKRLSDYTANHDLLTGLPNRRNFQNRLAEIVAEAEKQSGEAGLIYIDLNKFKTVNDKMGHDRGDKLLQEVAEQLRSAIGDEHVAARLGGDEFAVIVSATGGLENSVKDLTDTIHAALQILVETPEGGIPVGAALGVALYPADGASATDLLRNADQAMYAAKSDKDKSIMFYKDLTKASVHLLQA